MLTIVMVTTMLSVHSRAVTPDSHLTDSDLSTGDEELTRDTQIASVEAPSRFTLYRHYNADKL